MLTPHQNQRTTSSREERARTVVFPYTSTLVGGSYISSSLLANYLHQQPQWNVRVCLPAQGANMRLFERQSYQPDSFNMTQLDSMKIRHSRIRYRLPLYGSLVLQALKYLRQHRPHLVHVNDHRTLHTWGVAATCLRIPVVWHVRAEKAEKVDALNLRLSTYLILVAKANLVRFKQFALLPPHTVIHNPVDFTSFFPPDNRDESKARLGLSPQRLTLGFVGNLVARKRPEWAVQAAIDLLNDGLPVQLLLVGRDYSPAGEYGKQLARMVYDAGAEAFVHLLGYREDVPDLLRACDLSLLCSVEHGEAFPRAVIEAMASRVAVVATKVAGVPEAIRDGETGVLAEPNNYGDFYRQVKCLVEDDALRARIAERAYQEARARFSTSRHGQQVMAVYEQVLDHS